MICPLMGDQCKEQECGMWHDDTGYGGEKGCAFKIIAGSLEELAFGDKEEEPANEE